MEKVMLRGGLEAMCFLINTFAKETLRASLEQRGRQVLPPRELAFWALYGEVPREVLASWVAEARERERQWRG